MGIEISIDSKQMCIYNVALALLSSCYWLNLMRREFSKSESIQLSFPGQTIGTSALANSLMGQKLFLRSLLGIIQSKRVLITFATLLRRICVTQFCQAGCLFLHCLQIQPYF